MRSVKLTFIAAFVPLFTFSSLCVLTATEAGREEEGDRSRTASTRSIASEPPVKFDAKGAMIRPEGYRAWIYVGTPLTPNDMNGGEAPFPEFHNVYIPPHQFAQYEKNGEFPDGTVLVKELVSVGKKAAPSGRGYFMGEFIGLEVAMKDTKRFKDAPGNWAYFSFGHKYPLKSSATSQPVASCNSCHENTAQQDFVFTQFYPVLRAARPSGK